MAVIGWNPNIPRKNKARRTTDGATFNIERIETEDVILRAHDDNKLYPIPKTRFVEHYTPYSGAEAVA